ncbi:MAG: ABC transporter ATP-binding protein [Pseudomonadota bacterium]
MTNALSFSNVTKKFGAVDALSEVTFSVARGEFFALVGVNGAGKTTLIKCLLDFCAVDGGNINICGASHREFSSRKNLAFLPERFTPPYYLTGHDFLDMMRRLHGANFAAVEIGDMLTDLDFPLAALSKPVRSLSKGMTQKLGLAGTLLTAKPVFVLDEPMSGLDPKARALLKSKLAELKNAGATVFFTSHQLIDVAELAERMAVLHDGKLRFCGSPKALQSEKGSGDLETAFLQTIA